MTFKQERRIKTQLKTWLAAVGIGYEDTTSGLVVTNKDGVKVPVSVKGSATRGGVAVQGSDLTGRNLKKSLETFSKLQAQLGYDPRVPVDRGPIPTNNTHDFDLIVLRHADFRRSPNPTTAQLKAFELVVNKAAWRFFRKSNQTCLDHGLEVDDLRSYALAWTVNYLGIYRDDSLTVKENERNLFQYLSQRFMQFREYLDVRGKNILPMLDDAYIAMHGRPYEYSNKSDWFTADPEADNAWEIPTEDQGEAKEVSGAQRDRTKKQTVAILDEKLAGMPHDDMVAILSGAVSNDRIHLDARQAASRRLQAHAQACQACSGADLPSAPGGATVPSGLPIEDEKGNRFTTPKEAARAHGVFPSNVRAVLTGKYRQTGGHVFRYVQGSA